MNVEQIKEQFIHLGQEDALRADPTVRMSDELLWRAARAVVNARLRRRETGEQDWPRAKATAQGAYIEGWLCSHWLMTTVSHLRTTSQVWTPGYRSAQDRERLRWFFDERDEQVVCRLLVDIRYRPISPHQPQWSRKQLLACFRHQYRYVHALANKHYNDRTWPIELVDEQAGLAYLVGWLQAGWDLILLCACADARTCHRRLVGEPLSSRVKDNARIRVHLPGKADTVETRPVDQDGLTGSQTDPR